VKSNTANFNLILHVAFVMF